MKKLHYIATMAAFKTLPLLILLGACSQEFDPDQANDADIQRALHGVSNIFAQLDWVDDFDDKVNETGFIVHRRAADETLRCPDEATACVRLEDDAIAMELHKGTGFYTYCPDVPSQFIHESFHILKYLETGKGDSEHKDERWSQVDERLTLIDMCAPGWQY